jgi:hypothetical protein
MALDDERRDYPGYAAMALPPGYKPLWEIEPPGPVYDDATLPQGARSIRGISAGIEKRPDITVSYLHIVGDDLGNKMRMDEAKGGYKYFHEHSPQREGNSNWRDEPELSRVGKHRQDFECIWVANPPSRGLRVLPRTAQRNGIVESMWYTSEPGTGADWSGVTEGEWPADLQFERIRDILKHLFKDTPAEFETYLARSGVSNTDLGAALFGKRDDDLYWMLCKLTDVRVGQLLFDACNETDPDATAFHDQIFSILQQTRRTFVPVHGYKMWIQPERDVPYPPSLGTVKQQTAAAV